MSEAATEIQIVLFDTDGRSRILATAIPCASIGDIPKVILWREALYAFHHPVPGGGYAYWRCVPFQLPAGANEPPTEKKHRGK